MHCTLDHQVDVYSGHGLVLSAGSVLTIAVVFSCRDDTWMGPCVQKLLFHLSFQVSPLCPCYGAARWFEFEPFPNLLLSSLNFSNLSLRLSSKNALALHKNETGRRTRCSSTERGSPTRCQVCICVTTWAEDWESWICFSLTFLIVNLKQNWRLRF
jgi:hypothetical protein